MYINHNNNNNKKINAESLTFAAVSDLLPLSYSWKIWWGIKFGSLAVYNYYNRQIIIHQNFLLTYNYTYGNPVPNQIPLQYIAILGSIAKFNSHQYFQLYGSTVEPPNKGHFGNGPLVLCSKVVPISEVHNFSTHFDCIILNKLPYGG